ncbi:MAG: urease accessory UreF family protein [Gammaproteobacteria bacterium]|nr:urease accessory UreF family protein [Gammaproteobacteria bacterium]
MTTGAEAARPAVEGGALVRLLQLASAASPVGSFALSEALEHAVFDGLVHDEASARDWIGGLLRHATCALDVPLLIRMHAAWSEGRDDAALGASAWLLACRESAELRSGDRRQGQALLRVLHGAGVAAAGTLLRDQRVGYACAFALAADTLGIAPPAAGVAFAYAWLENLTLAAVKLVPLGQIAGQRMLFDLGSEIPDLCASAARREPDDIAAGAPGQALASALHESQATRIYQS